MTNGTEILSGSTGLPLAPITSLPQWMGFLAQGVMEVEGRPALPASMMPNKTQRESIASRIEALERELAQADRREVAVVVGKLFMAFPSTAASVDAQRAKIALYVEDLDGLPLWALDSAASKWRRGEVTGDVKFAPSAGELRRIAEAQTLPHRALIAKLNRVLVAQELRNVRPEPAERERVAQKFGDLLKSFTDRDGASA